MLTMETDFVGPPDIGYPMLQVGRDKFTDAERVNRRSRDAAAAAAERKAKFEADKMTAEQKKLAEFAKRFSRVMRKLIYWKTKRCIGRKKRNFLNSLKSLSVKWVTENRKFPRNQ